MPSLSDFYSLEVTRLQGLLSAAKAAASLARQGEANANANLVAANETLAQARSDAAAARKALARIPLPADGDALVLALRLALRHEASAQSTQLAAALALSQASASRSQAELQVSEWTARLGLIQAQAKAEQAASLERELWKAAAAVTAPEDPPSLAAEALSLFKTAAKTKIEADFPAYADVSIDSSKDFLTRVRARRLLAALPLEQAAQLQDDAVAQAIIWQEATGRAADKLPALRAKFAEACAALQQYYLAPTKLAAASSQLQALAERVSSPLSAAQRAELFATNNSTLATEREDAVAALSLRDEAQKTLFERREDYARALLPLQLAHPGATEADLRALDASLNTHFSNLTAAAQDLVDADADPALVSHLQVLMDWFTAVPEALWQQFEALESSIALLQDIQAMTPASLLNDVQSSESALVSQLQAVQEEQTRSDLRASLLLQAQAQTAAAAEVALNRLAAASRFVELV